MQVAGLAQLVSRFLPSRAYAVCGPALGDVVVGLRLRGYAVDWLGAEPGGDQPAAPATRQVLLATVDDESDCARAEHLAERCGSRALLLIKRRGPLGRADLERWFISRGWRRSPFIFRFAQFAQLNDDGGEQVVVLERLPPGLGEMYPPEWLQRERDLHMDMSREAGSRSDAHLVRYAWACQFVRRGDRVLDIACGMGYGSYLVRRNTEAGIVLGADNSATSVRYAKASFRTRGLGFRQLDAENLRALREARFDVVLSFETLEHLREPEAFLQDVWRLLRPSGRVIVSVPNDWSDATGRDPNPHHFHVYTLETLERQIARNFEVECWASECSDRVKADDGSWKTSRRSLDEYRRREDAAGHDAEWWLACAMKSPVGASAPYTESAFTPGEVAASGNVLAFPRDYANAWLVRGLVTMGLRAANDDVLEKWSRQALESMRGEPVDKAALICVLLYRALGRLTTQLDKGADLIRLQADASTLAVASGRRSRNPTAVRWRVSLAYALAQVKLLRGELPDAAVLLETVARSEVSQYSILLHSKTLGAAFQLAAIRAADEPKAAARALLASTRKALREVSLWVAEHISTEHPDFFFREIAEIVDAGLRNFNAAKLLLAGVGVAAFETAVGRSLAGRAQAAEAAFASARAELRHASSVHAWLDDQYRLQRQLAHAQGLAVAAKGEELARAHEELVTTKSGKDWLEEQYRRYVAHSAELEARVGRLLDEKAWLDSQYTAYKDALVAAEQQWAGLRSEVVALRNGLASAEAGRQWLESQFHAYRDLAQRKEREGLEYLERNEEARREINRLQVVVDETGKGKTWLEAQFVNYRELAERLQRTIEVERQARAESAQDLAAQIRQLHDAKLWLEQQYDEYRLLAERNRKAIDELLAEKMWLEEQYVAFKRLAGESERSVKELAEGKQWLEAQFVNYRELAERLQRTIEVERQAHAESAQDLAAQIRQLHDAKLWLEQQYDEYRLLAERNRKAIDELLAEKMWLEEQYVAFKRLADENERSFKELAEGKQWLEAQYHSYKGLSEDLRIQLDDSRERGLEVERDLTDARDDGQRLAEEVATLRAELDSARQRARELEIEKHGVSIELAAAASRIDRFRRSPLVKVLLAARLIKDDPN